MQRFPVEIDGRRVMLGAPSALLVGAAASGSSSTEDRADPAVLCVLVPGALVRWFVEDGAEVVEGDAVGVLNAMKMETPVSAHRTGVLTQATLAGTVVAMSAVLGRIEEG